MNIELWMGENLLNLVKQPSFLACVIELFLDGETLGKLLASKSQVANLFTKYQHNLQQIKKEKKVKLSMFESAHLNKWMISNVKNSSYKPNFQTIKSLMMLDQVLTLNDMDFSTFYNWLSKETLKKLSYQAKTGFVDLDMNLYTGYVNNTIQKSWFSNQVKKLKNNSSLLTYCQSSKFTHANGMDVEDTQLRVKKVKLRLKSNQKAILKQWNNHARYTYNSTVWRLNTDLIKSSKLTLRNDLVAAKNNTSKEWLLETPKEIRARAVFEGYTRWKTGCQQVKNKTIKFFNLGYKDKHYQDRNGWTIDIQKQSITKKDNKTVYIYKRITNGEEFSLCEPVGINIDHDCKIHFDGIDYFLIIPYKEEKEVVREVDNGVISLDPGVRTFLSGVDHEKAIEIGNGSGTTMFRLLRQMDKLISRVSKSKGKKKHKLQIQIKSIKKHIKNKQEELHKKTSTWLCKQYSNIVIPQFGSKDMVKKKDRKLRTKTVRSMCILGHGKFLERLKIKAKQWGTNVIIVDERYTSKTCGACGNVKTKHFTSKTYKCEKCEVCIDRDTNGAINIFKKLFK